MVYSRIVGRCPAVQTSEQHSAVLSAGLPRTEILKSLLVWTVPTFAPMSLLWLGDYWRSASATDFKSEWRKQPANTRSRILTRILPREPMRVIRSFCSLLISVRFSFASRCLVCRGCGSALKDDLAADQRQVRLDVLDLLFRHGHVVRGEHHDVGKLSGPDRPLLRFLKGVVRGRTGVEAQGLLATDGFRSAVDVSIRILPGHHDVHVEERIDRINGEVGSGAETVEPHFRDQRPGRHGAVSGRPPQKPLDGRGLVPHEDVLEVDADSQPVRTLHLLRPDQTGVDEDETTIPDRFFLVGCLERVEHLVDTEVTDDVHADTPAVAVADRDELLQPFGG